MFTSILSAITAALGVISGVVTWLTGMSWKNAGVDQQALKDVKEQDNVNAKAKAESDASVVDLARNPSDVMRDDGFQRRD